jgi:transcriptional regulator with XRE-family HTH domain
MLNNIVKVGEQIKYFRKDKGISLESLGLDIGLDGSNMNKIEKGQNITLATLFKILSALKITPKDFFYELELNTDEFESKRKQFPELDCVANKLANETAYKINFRIINIESKMPYKAQYVLEEVIKILKDKV